MAEEKTTTGKVQEEFSNKASVVRAKANAYKEEYSDIFAKCIEILNTTLTPPGTNASRKGLDHFTDFLQGLKYSQDISNLEEFIYDYFAIFHTGYNSMITHYHTQKLVWWIKEYQDEIGYNDFLKLLNKLSENKLN